METLTKKEEEVMQVIWIKKKGFVKDFIAEMPKPKPPYNTISSIVRILVKKGFLNFKQYGNTYEYFQIISKKKYRKKTLKKMLSGYFEGSYKNLVSFIAKEKKLDNDTINKILKMIEKSEEKKKDA